MRSRSSRRPRELARPHGTAACSTEGIEFTVTPAALARQDLPVPATARILRKGSTSSACHEALDAPVAAALDKSRNKFLPSGFGLLLTHFLLGVRLVNAAWSPRSWSSPLRQASASGRAGTVSPARSTTGTQD
jgi:hypothetical protein